MLFFANQFSHCARSLQLFNECVCVCMCLLIVMQRNVSMLLTLLSLMSLTNVVVVVFVAFECVRARARGPRHSTHESK